MTIVSSVIGAIFPAKKYVTCHHTPARFVLASLLFCLVPLSIAQERTLTEEQREKLAKEGELDGETVVTRPSKLPDLTKGDRLGEKNQGDIWSLGPTGIVGYLVGGFKGD